jgi:hypothetical protein
MKKKKKKDTTAELPAMTGPGVAPIRIEAIDKAAKKYEAFKLKRSQISPDEKDAKLMLHALLLDNRDKLPINGDGKRFYRMDGIDYILDETMKRKSATSGNASGATED